MSEEDVLASAERGSVVAAAGCGKTELIAKAVGKCSGRQLVLTHTNAGVETIRRRLRRFGIRGSSAGIDTIDGWCMKYVAAYPSLSGGVPESDGTTDWLELRARMVKLLEREVIRKVVCCSYEGVLVDEYQDCGEDQHAVVCKLATLRPVRVLGDPMQAIFSWAGPLPDWSAVTAAFPHLLTLEKPWRWDKPGENAALGKWLAGARGAFESGTTLQLGDHRIRYIQIPAGNGWYEAARAACFDAVSQEGTIVAICKWPSDCHRIARMTGGMFQCVEAIEARDGGEMLAKLEASEAARRPHVLQEFAEQVSVHIGDHLKVIRDALAKPDCVVPPAIAEVVAALVTVRDGGTWEASADALEAMLSLQGVRVFRRELAWAVLDTLREAGSGPASNLRAALRARRNLSSHVGRRLARCTLGTTPLVKGMEFDHAVVIHTGGPKGFTSNELYVALTRGSKSLTVLAASDAVDTRSLPVAAPQRR